MSSSDNKLETVKEDVLENAQNVSGVILEEIKEKVEELKEKVDEVKEKVEEVKEKVEEVKEEVKEKVEDVKEKVENTIDEVSKVVENKVEVVNQQIEEGNKLVNETVQEVKQKIEENINLVKNLELYKTIEKQVLEIMKDGKIDQNDIPQILVIITKSYNEYKQLRLPESELNELYKSIFNKILSNCKDLAENKKEKFQKLFESSLQLLLVTPDLPNVAEVVEATKGCVGCIVNFFKK